MDNYIITAGLTIRNSYCVLHLEITMAFPHYFLKVSFLLFPLHTESSKEGEKNTGSHQGEENKWGGCLLPAPVPLPPCWRTECPLGWVEVWERQSDRGGLETGELAVVTSCSSSTSTSGLKPVKTGLFCGKPLWLKWSFCFILKDLLWYRSLGLVRLTYVIPFFVKLWSHSDGPFAHNQSSCRSLVQRVLWGLQVLWKTPLTEPGAGGRQALAERRAREGVSTPSPLGTGLF